MSTDKVILKLLKQWGSHNSGEIAGFVPHVAEKLIAQGLATPLDAPAESAEPVEGAEVGDEPAEPGEGAQPAAAAPKKSSKKSA